MSVLEDILKARGLTGSKRDAFLNPSYDNRHDPFLLPDMRAAVDRLVSARKNQEKVVIYGDYDIDGLTATTVLLDSFEKFGFRNIDAYIPNRFVEGYGLTVEAVEKIAAMGADVIVTVDCGSLSEKEIVRANELGVDVIVTDHHNVAPVQPPAIGVINPKRLLQDYPDEYENLVLKDGSKLAGKIYPFLDLAGVGVAFKLVQALQTELPVLEQGQEKWLLDLVALGTVCDVVQLVDENRANVFWGLKVLSKTRRKGLRALMAVSGVEPSKVNARSLGFALGPRMNAAGRLETAQYALDMLRATEDAVAFELAQKLDDMNVTRKNDQNKIYNEAVEQAELYLDDNVLVVSGKDWSHGIIGIVAAKLLEKYHKPTFVLEEMDDESKGSARSFGDFSVADAIRYSDDVITKGGGHKYAAGVTLPTANIAAFRAKVNEFYRIKKLLNQELLLLPRAEVDVVLGSIDERVVGDINTLEPFGNGNPQPILRINKVIVVTKRIMGDSGQHIKLEFKDQDGTRMQMLAFSAPSYFYVDIGTELNAWFQPDINEWNGRRSVEGRLLHIEVLL